MVWRVCTVLGLCLLLGGCPKNGTRAASGEARKPVRCPGHSALTLPAGFCAQVFADVAGSARHVVVRANGDVYVALRGADGGLVALRDVDGDGVADRQERLAAGGGTGIAIYDGYLYFARPTSIVRYPFNGDELLPEQVGEVVVAGFVEQDRHATKTVVFDDAGWLYTNIGAPSNACQDPPRSRGAAGLDPCPQLRRQAGIWRFRADQIGQDAYSDGVRFAGGIRNAIAMAWHPVAGRLYAVQHGRDELSELWPDIYTMEQRAQLPAEELFAVDEGDEFGWPYCYYDSLQQRKVLAPEYGGDGTIVGRCAGYEDPLVAFPAHWAPNAMAIYTGRHFPSAYRDGAFVAFHGSWNRAPAMQAGYNVAFVPMRNGLPSADYEVFAEGFTGVERVRSPAESRHRPSGVAQAPDGRLYVSDSSRGRLWRISYETPAESAHP